MRRGGELRAGENCAQNCARELRGARDRRRVRREDLHDAALGQLPHPRRRVLRAGEQHGAARVPRHPVDALRRPLERRADERARVGLPHAHRAVEPARRQQRAVHAERERAHRVRVALEPERRRLGAEPPQVRDVVAAARREHLGVRGVHRDREDGLGVRQQPLRAVVRRRRRERWLRRRHLHARVLAALLVEVVAVVLGRRHVGADVDLLAADQVVEGVHLVVGLGLHGGVRCRCCKTQRARMETWTLESVTRAAPQV